MRLFMMFLLTRFGLGDGRCHVAAIQAAKNGLDYWIRVSRFIYSAHRKCKSEYDATGMQMAQQSSTKLLAKSRQ